MELIIYQCQIPQGLLFVLFWLTIHCSKLKGKSLRTHITHMLYSVP